jgi:hypothetical protein
VGAYTLAVSCIHSGVAAPLCAHEHTPVPICSKQRSLQNTQVTAVACLLAVVVCTHADIKRLQNHLLLAGRHETCNHSIAWQLDISSGRCVRVGWSPCQLRRQAAHLGSTWYGYQARPHMVLVHPSRQGRSNKALPHSCTHS